MIIKEYKLKKNTKTKRKKKQMRRKMQRGEKNKNLRIKKYLHMYVVYLHKIYKKLQIFFIASSTRANSCFC